MLTFLYHVATAHEAMTDSDPGNTNADNSAASGSAKRTLLTPSDNAEHRGPRWPRRLQTPALALDHGHSRKEIEQRISGSSDGLYLRDAVYGGIDGAVTTFSIVAGVAGAGLDHQVIVALGIANVLADGFSMAAGNYAGMRADQDNLERLRAMEARHIRDYPEGETQEIRTILEQKGLAGESLDAAVVAITSHKPLWEEMMLLHEHGVSPIDSKPKTAALVTFVAFVIAGCMPLAAFLWNMAQPFGISIVLTVATFLLIGALKSRWSVKPWWHSALQTLAIGATAGAIAWVSGDLAGRLM